jgi:hypothetical protein
MDCLKNKKKLRSAYLPNFFLSTILGPDDEEYSRQLILILSKNITSTKNDGKLISLKKHFQKNI